jgi:primosomal protein N' (replication factor Y)
MTGRYRLIKLTERILKRELPKVRIVDMKREISKRKKVVAFSLALEEAVNKTVARKKQAILFLNRRGFSTHLDCRKCGHVLKCKKCESVLVYHADLGKLACHYCSRKFDVPKICPSCESAYVKFAGLGTQKVESELHRVFPQARIARMDTDATARRGSHEKILEDFKEGRTDILIGTQMIAKGLDYPQVTLVGVVMADTSLNVPDFRASERAFDLLTQVAGRAGRPANPFEPTPAGKGEEPSEVIIQTYAPKHYAILCASRHDYEGFYEREIRSRRLLGFPPYYRLVKFTLQSAKSENAEQAAGELARRLKGINGIKVAGPAPSPIIKIRGRFRWNVFVKAKPGKDFSLQLRPVIAEFKKGRRAFLTVDVDPISG